MTGPYSPESLAALSDEALSELLADLAHEEAGEPGADAGELAGALVLSAELARRTQAATKPFRPRCRCPRREGSLAATAGLVAGHFLSEGYRRCPGCGGWSHPDPEAMAAYWCRKHRARDLCRCGR